MNQPLAQCPACRAWLIEGIFNQRRFTPCPTCAVPLQIDIFPAQFRQIGAGQSGEIIMTEGESSCFYHPQKKAVLPCDGCGRFLCALCDCPLDGQHLCPTCLETGKTKGKIKSLDNQRMRYDGIAMALALFPMLIFYFTIITAPMTLFVAIRYWNAPRSLVQRTRVRYIIAIILALLQITGWTTLIIAISTHHHA